jgi:hypothetical protein
MCQAKRIFSQYSEQKRSGSNYCIEQNCCDYRTDNATHQQAKLRPIFVQRMKPEWFQKSDEKKYSGNRQRPPTHRVVDSQWRKSHQSEEKGENDAESAVGGALGLLFPV